jgi:hypothetical protein
MKHIQNGIVAGILGICLAGPALAHGAAGGGSMGVTSPAAMGTHNTAPATPASTPRAIGQPNQSCGSATAPNTPGNAASARGSAFNPNGVAGQMYAGQQPQNSNNPAAVSQYDAACSHQPQ